MVLVPLYDTLGHDGVTFIIQQTTMKIIVVDHQGRAETILKKYDEYKHLHLIVVMEEFNESLRDMGASNGVTIVSLCELEEIGQKLRDTPSPLPPSPSDLATICYTSGTTGLPKGVMLTHANVVADCTSLSVCKYTFPTSDDVAISYLPLAHMFERVIEAMVLSVGGKIGFYRGDIKTLSEDLIELKPTIMPTVPRLLTRVYDRAMAEARTSFVKQWIFNYAVWSKTCDLNKRIIRTDSWWDCLIFKRIRSAMGGRLRLIITGSAPCPPETLTFMRIALGCVILEGYGQTESVAAATVSLEGDHVPGHVGPPLPCSMVKLIDVEEMNYYAKDGRGEVCIKGPIVFAGYYKDPEKTKEVIDSEGWLHTGDVGRWTERGTLQLIDRKKHIFKLSQGEYIAPEKLEAVYNKCKFIQQTFVYGESLRNFLIGVVVPDMEFLGPEVNARFGLSAAGPERFNNHKDVKDLILNEMKTVAKEAKLNSFEEVKAIYICGEPFTVENGLLTPTFKSKRQALKQRFAKQLEYLYASMPTDPKFSTDHKN
uniref:long-chain-fatty-acid--CoA ligase n=1 Tax=Romanomermis culicivorax TaxID=13658 RepID=A0A915J4X0_ROMCU